MGFFERMQVANPGQDLPHKPVFIIGAPRSGSTLLYQSLITSLDFSYLSNLHCLMFGMPWLIEKMFHPSNHFKGSQFQSRRGTVRGWNSPSECAEFWYRFFPRHPHHITRENADPHKMKVLRNAIHALTRASSKPLLIKNLHCSMRLQPLADTLPEALFIVLHRKETDTAHSILAARKNQLGSYNRWFSVEPPNIEQLKQLPPQQQALEQVRSIYQQIREDELSIGSNRFYHLQYETFCKKPRFELQDIIDFLKDHGIDINKEQALPDHFERRTKIRIDKALYDQLIQYAQKGF